MKSGVSWGWIYAAFAVEGVVTLAALGLLIWVRRRTSVSAGPASRELTEEPPAVVNLLTHRFRVTREAAPATVIDLAARGVLAIDEIGPGMSVLSLNRADRDPGRLAPYERRVLTELQRLAVDGVVPAQACTLGPDDLSRQWWWSFSREVQADALERGLARGLFPAPSWSGVFLVLLLVPPLLIGIATRFDPELALGGGWTTLASMSVLVPLAVLLISFRGELLAVDAGRRAATRWLGVREGLTEVDFSGRGPAAVRMWDRYLAYGIAMGLAVDATRAIPFGAEDDRHAWSAVNGRWRLVRLSYPLWRPGWGRKPRRVLVGAVLTATAAGGCAAALAASDGTAIALPTAVIFAVIAFGALLLAVAAVVDLKHQRLYQGTILRLRAWYPDLDHGLHIIVHHPRWFLVLDNGRSDHLTAWSIDQTAFENLQLGDKIRIKTTPLLGHVTALTPLP